MFATKVFNTTEIPDCPVSELVQCIECSECCEEILNHWSRLARALNTPAQLRTIITNDLLLKRKQHLEVFEDILEDWILRNGEEAKLTTLIEDMQAKCRWRHLSGKR